MTVFRLGWLGYEKVMRQCDQQDRHGLFWHVIQCVKEADQLANADRSSGVDVGVAEQYDTDD